MYQFFNICHLNLLFKHCHTKNIIYLTYKDYTELFLLLLSLYKFLFKIKFL